MKRRAKRLPSTGIKSYDGHIARFNRARRPITARSLLQYIQEQRAAHSAATIRAVKFSFLKSLSFMGHAARIRHAREALRSLRVRVPGTTVRPEDVLSMAEVHRMVSESPKVWGLLWLALTVTGARIQSLLTIELRKCYTDFEKGVVTCFNTGKGGRVLDYELPLQLFGSIRSAYMGRRFLFERDGRPVSARSAQNAAQRLGWRILKKRVHPHLFRHSIATHLVSSGVELSQVSGFLHHAQNSTTADIYVHVRPDRTGIRSVLEKSQLLEVFNVAIKPQSRGISGSGRDGVSGRTAAQEHAESHANTAPKIQTRKTSRTRSGSAGA